tara:strand:+ start:124 stop:546 length:423 start_codon:yes stop_codon:yes gene_type:complete
MMLTAVPSEALDIVWGDVEELMERTMGVTKGKYSAKDIYDGVKEGIYAIWLVLDGEKPICALTTRIVQYPEGRKSLSIDWIGGTRMKEWLPLLQETMTKYAKDNQCTHLEGFGRQAWIKWIGKYGWKPAYVAFDMELDNE